MQLLQYLSDNPTFSCAAVTATVDYSIDSPYDMGNGFLGTMTARNLACTFMLVIVTSSLATSS